MITIINGSILKDGKLSRRPSLALDEVNIIKVLLFSPNGRLEDHELGIAIFAKNEHGAVSPIVCDGLLQPNEALQDLLHIYHEDAIQPLVILYLLRTLKFILLLGFLILVGLVIFYFSRYL